tara:strand:+ start:215 stop:913 length:699 start_codon:yes stop_codon:yes gene_type:complete
MTLLINGCSFAEAWNVSEEFQNKLGCTNTVNIGKDGTSFPRTLRSTVEWIAQNGNPEFAIIPITYAHRWEMAIAKKDDDIDGTWHPVLEEPHLNLDKIDLENIPEDKFKKLVPYYHGCVPNIRTYWDKIFTDIILLASLFEARGIKYLMCDMVNNFEMKHLAGYKGFSKLNLIKNNKNIVDLFSFCGNNFMYHKLPKNECENVDPYLWHHEDREYKHFEEYLIRYLDAELST